MVTEAHVRAYHASQIGTLESPSRSNRTKYGKWYGLNGFAWCDMYQSYVGHYSGAGSAIGKFSWTVAHANWFHAHGRWGTTPRVGALVFFDWSGGHSRSGVDHVGFVEGILRDGRLQTIEGNSNIGGRDGVWRHYRSHFGIVGYGYPNYAGAPSHSTAGSRIPPVLHRKPTKPKKLTADGVMGPLTVAAMQRALHVAADGEFGPLTKKALQKALGVPQTGHLSRTTIRALRGRMGVPAGPTWSTATTVAVQRSLNAGKFPGARAKKVVTTTTTTIAAIAAALGVSVAAIVGINPGTSPNKPVPPHTTITVPPIKKPVVPPKKKPVAKPVHKVVKFPGYTRVDYGSRGVTVRIMQAKLRADHIVTGPLDGQYGPKTVAAVRAFQKKHHLHVDGVVGPKTWNVLFH